MNRQHGDKFTKKISIYFKKIKNKKIKIKKIRPSTNQQPAPCGPTAFLFLR